jgi:hypothetical protein
MRNDALALLLCAGLAGCEAVPQPSPGPQGSSAANWSNDFMRAKSGDIWVVNGTWTHSDKILFRDQRFMTDTFIQMLGEQGISTNTPVSILQEPGVTMPPAEVSKFWQAGYLCRSLSLPKRYWKWWRRTHAQQITGANAG